MFNEKRRLWMAFAIIIICFAFLFLSPFVEVWGGSLEMVKENKQIIVITLTAAVSWVIGSSYGSAKKGDTIDRKLN